jgi:hypothetical protein
MDTDNHKGKLSSTEAESRIANLGERMTMLCRAGRRDVLEELGIDERVVEHLSACLRGEKLELRGIGERVMDLQAGAIWAGAGSRS